MSDKILYTGGPNPFGTCKDCGVALNEGEAKTFTVCDACWDKAYKKYIRIVKTEVKDDCVTKFTPPKCDHK